MTTLPLAHITSHIYTSPPDEETDRPVLGAVVGNNSVLMIEGGNSPAHAQSFLRALDKNNIGPPSYAALTHWHWDHVFGASELDIPIFAHVITAQVIRVLAKLDWRDEALKRRVVDGTEIEFCRGYMQREMSNQERGNITLRVPDITYRSQVEIDLGCVSAHLLHVGGNHSSDSVVIFIPHDRVVFLGDCIYDAIYDIPRNFTTAKLFPLLDRLTNLDAELYLAAHQKAPLSKNEFAQYAKQLKTIGGVVDRTGPDRQAVVIDLERLSGSSLDAEQRETVDLFIAGLGERRSITNSFFKEML
jgi:glyoxylase-like metal-dependent hydrolase (beta-lactamase superfamily II)